MGGMEREGKLPPQLFQEKEKIDGVRTAGESEQNRVPRSDQSPLPDKALYLLPCFHPLSFTA